MPPRDGLWRSTARQTNRQLTPFSFLQSSDFRLDTPCRGIGGLPTDIRERYVEARYLAAERVIDAAIERAVDFVVLAGGLLDARLPGLRGPWFLAGQFRRLARAGIDVYWAGSSLETRGRWPAHVELPPNVHRLSTDTSGILHGRNGHPLARLVTVAASPSRHTPRSDTFTIAVQPRSERVPESPGEGVDYWALGGLPEQETMQSGEVIAHFAGSPQGRSPEETDRHGCSLIDVETDGTVRIEPVLTDLVRWHRLRVPVDSSTSWSDLEQDLDSLQSQLRDRSPAEIGLVSWTIQGCGPAFERLLQPRFHAELLGRLNRRTPRTAPLLWTTSIEALVEPQQRSEWGSLKTPLGAFLRELDDLSPHVEELFGTAADGWHPLGTPADPSRQRLVQQVVNEAAQWLGTGDEPLRHAG